MCVCDYHEPYSRMDFQSFALPDFVCCVMHKTCTTCPSTMTRLAYILVFDSVQWKSAGHPLLCIGTVVGGRDRVLCIALFDFCRDMSGTQDIYANCSGGKIVGGSLEWCQLVGAFVLQARLTPRFLHVIANVCVSVPVENRIYDYAK